jgi:hypothetical protein
LLFSIDWIVSVIVFILIVYVIVFILKPSCSYFTE